MFEQQHLHQTNDEADSAARRLGGNYQRDAAIAMHAHGAGSPPPDGRRWRAVARAVAARTCATRSDPLLPPSISQGILHGVVHDRRVIIIITPSEGFWGY